VTLAVLASRVRFEEKQIFAALDRRRVPYVHLDTRQLAAPVSDEASAGPSHEENPPRGRTSERWGTYAAALNREISQSRGYYASLLFEAWGVPTVNRAAVIEVCGDKLRTSLELKRSGLPTPRTALALTPEAALHAADLLGYPVVIKPLAGSWGRLASLVRDRAEAETVLEHRAALPSPQQHIVYLQELVDKPDRDIRVLVAGERVVAASYRYADGWRTNARRGGRSEPCPLTPELTGLALAAAKAVGGGVLGVDLIEGPDGLQVLEVNHTVEFQGLQSAHDVDVADAIVSHALDAA
jgi:[lysine-biosynthesis-protein LysW]---L-2-aminoadipate ligase